MRNFVRLGLAGGVLVVAVTLSQAVVANAIPGPRADEPNGPFAGPPVTGAPFSAIATTTVHGRLTDGSPIQQASTAYYYRDGAGRVRVEQTVPGSQPRVTIRTTDIGKGLVYLLAADKKSATVGPRFAADRAVGGGRSFALPVDRLKFLIFRPALLRVTSEGESLGTKTIEGVEVLGRRFTSPAEGQTYERWHSPDLAVVVAATHTDERTVVIEYRLTNLRRGEPDAELFALPADQRMSNSEPCWISLVPAENPQNRSGCTPAR